MSFLMVACAALALAISASVSHAVAQSVVFSGQMRSFPLNGGSPGVLGSVAIDGSDNIYVADGGNSQVLVYNPLGKLIHTYAQPSGVSGLAVSGGYLYVADGYGQGPGGHQINLSNGASTHFNFQGTQLGILNTPQSFGIQQIAHIIVDSNAYVWGDDSNGGTAGNGSIKQMLTLSNSSTLHQYPDSTGNTMDTNYYSFTNPGQMAHDANGNVFILTPSPNVIRQMSVGNVYTPPSTYLGPLSGSVAAMAFNAAGDLYYLENSISGVLTERTAGGLVFTRSLGNIHPFEMAVDSHGSVFFTNNGTLTELAPNVDFGSVSAASTPTQTLIYNFLSATTLTGITATTAGAGSLDFTLGSGTCVTGHAYAPGDTCTVIVNFAPGAIGPREGAVELDAAGGVLLQTPLRGTVTGPQGVVESGTQSTLVASGLIHPSGEATDASGNTYVADTGNNRVVKVTSGGTVTPVTTGSALSAPQGVAVDGAGNLYIADTGHSRVLKETGSAETVVGSGWNGPTAVAVDGYGDIFVADTGNARVVEFSINEFQYTLPATGLSSPSGVAVDATGNVYITDTTLSYLVKVAPDGTNTHLGNALSGAQQITVDPAGLLYIADAANSRVVELTAGGTQTTLAAGLTAPHGVVVDAAGTVTIADWRSGGDVLVKLARTPHTFDFGTIVVGQTTAQQVATLRNIGNLNLSATALSAPTGYNLSGGATTCTSSSTLTPGASCAVGVVFAPHGAGTLTGTVNVTDNHLGGTGTVQQLASVTGVSTPVAADIALSGSPSSPVLYGTAVTLTATLTGVNGTPTGSIGYTIDGGGAQTAALSGGVATIALSSVLGVGTHGVVVSYAGDTGYTAPTTSQSFTLTVNKRNQTITFASIAAQTYGNAAFTISPTSSLGGGYPVSVAVSGPATLSGGTVTMTGSGTVTLTATQTGDANTNAATTVTRSFTVAQAALTVTANSFTRSYGTANPALTGTVTGVVNNDTITATYATPATISTNPGTYNIVPSVTGANLSSYAVTLNSGTLTITLTSATSVPLLVSSSNPALPGQTVVIRATVPTVGGVVPTGTMNFQDGNGNNYGQVFGVDPSLNGSGVADFTAPAGTFPTGSTVLTATYSGDSLYQPTVSATLTQVVLAPAPAAALSISSPGSVATGTPVTATATLTAGGSGVGQVLLSFYDTGSSPVFLGTASTNLSGVATLTRIFGAGTHTFTAVYAGINAGTTGLTSSPSTTVVTGNGSYPTATAITKTGSPGAYTLTGTTTLSGKVAPTGSVSFQDATNGNAVLGTGLLGSYVGGLLPPVLYSTGIYASNPAPDVLPIATATGDLNGDGKLDLVVANYIDGVSSGNAYGTLSVLLGNGDGTFTAGVTLPSASYPSSVTLADVDGDGHLDLIVGSDGNNVFTIFLGDGTGNFTQTTSGNPTTGSAYLIGAAVADFDKDGIPDIVGTGNSGTAFFWHGNGDGTFGAGFGNPTTSQTTGNNALGITTGDYNGDGNPDFVVTNAGDGTVQLFTGDGTGNFTPATAISAGTVNSYPNAIVTGDFNGDGYPDLAVALQGDNKIAVLINNHAGGFNTPVLYAAGSNGPGNIALGDMNADGKDDLIVVNTVTVNGAGLGVNRGGNTFDTADSDNTLGIFLSNGDGTFQTMTTVATGAGTVPYAATVGDFNGDGLPDIAVPNAATDNLGVFIDYRTGTATLTGAAVTNAGPVQVRAQYLHGTSDAYANSTSPTNVQLQGSSTPVINSSAASSPVGSSLTLTITLPVQGGVTPTGTVQLKDGGPNLGSALNLASGVATYTTSALTQGTHTLTAVYSGDASFVTTTSTSFTQTITRPTTTDTLTANSGGAVAYGTSITFTATLANNTATGTIAFMDGAIQLGSAVTLAGGIAHYSTSALTGGAHAITAMYSGDSNFSGNTSSPLSQTINLSSAATTTLTGTGTPSAYGSTVTFTAMLGNSSATGTVAFKDNGTTIGTGNVASGVATFATSTLTVGTHPITAVYSGDTNFATSTSSTLTEVINQTTPVLGAPGLSPTSATFGSSVTITQTVPAGVTGSITFFANGVSLGTALISGTTATLTTSAMPGGVNSITGVSSANANYTAATSSAASITIARAAPTIPAPTASPNPSTYGASVTLTQNMPNAATGSVTFYAGATSLGTGNIVSNVATLATTALPVGTLVLTTQYAGDGNYLAATSASGSTVVNTSPTATSLSTSPTSGTYGVSVTFTATVNAGGSPLVGGSVNFQVAGSTVGTGTTNGSGVATFTTATLSAGTNSVTAVSVATGNYNASTSSAVTVTISQATPSLTAPTLSPTSSTYGTSVTITQAVPNGVTGTVSFYAGTTLLGTGTISGGVATLTTTAIPTGTSSITGSYGGSTNYTPATSAGSSITVAQATPVLAAPSLSPAGAIFGTSVTITQTVPSGVTGSITFYANGVSLGTALISGTTATLTTSAIPGGTNAITAASNANTNYTAATSAAASITISPATLAIPAPTASVNPSTYGAGVTLTQAMPSGATGSVTFYAGATSLGTGSIVSGSATLATTALTVGTLTLTTHYAGNANYAAGTSAAGSTVVNAAPTSTSLFAAPGSGSYGISVTLTATVTAGGSALVGGSVNFQVAGTTIGTGTTNGSGVATFTTTTLNAGANSVMAVFLATGNYNASTSSAVTVTISQATPSLTAPTLSPASSTYGTSVTITQAVPNGVTGTISFYAGATLLGTGTISGGMATLTTAAIPAGTNAITGSYGGNTNFTTATSSAASITVAQATPVLAAPSASPTSATYGTSVTLTQAVPPNATGTITFYRNGVSLGSATISGGVATLNTTALPTGTNSLTTQYGGNANYTAATSATGSIVISVAPTVTILSGSPTSGPFGTSIVLSAAVTANGVAVTTGTVDFQSGGASLGTVTVNGSGVASLTTTTLNVAANVVSALFGATGNYAASTSSPTTITITQATPSLVAPGISPTGGPYGSIITLTQSFPPGATGTASFYSGGTFLGTANITGGIATLTTNALPAGSNTVTTQWPGSGNYTAATSAPATVVITQATPVLGAPSSSPANPAFGSPVTITQAVPPGATGTVTFTSGGVTLGTATITGGIATINTSSLPSGSNSILATYNGNANYTTATATGSLTVAPATPSLGAPTASPASGSYGTSVTLTQTVPSGLTGTITFMSGSTVLGTATISGGVATLVAPLLPAGSNSITGLYGGNTNYGAATSAPGAVTISQITPTLTAPSASPSSITYGGSVTLTQTVPPGATGTVTFASGATVLGTATISGGVATLVTTAIPGGSSPVTGFYNGNNNYTSALSAASTVTVSPVIPVLAQPGASPTGGPYGTPITLTQTMPTGATGIVTFTVNGVVLGTATIVNGVATLTTTSIPAGTNITVGVFPGSGNYAAATSAPTTITITQATPVLPGTAVSPSSASFGSSVTLTQSVPPGATGTVTFVSGGVSLGVATISNGVATLTTSSLPLGNQTVVATYNGNSNYTAATAVAGSVTITQATSTLSAPSAAPPTASYGASVTLTQSVPPGLTGIVTFMSGTSVLGTAIISGGVATLTTGALQTGANAITGVYGGSANYTSATSPATTVTITPASTTLAAPSASPSSITYGGIVTLTQTVPPAATGTVTFTSGTTVLGTSTIANGVATLVTTAIPGGSSPVTGMYNGNPNYAATISAAATVTVAPAVPVLAAPGASPAGGPYGTAVTLTQTMPPGATGTVTFTANGVVVGMGTIVNGVASLVTTSIPAGTNITVGAYPGNGNYTTGTSAPTTITIAQATPVLASPAASPMNSPFGGSVTLTQPVPPGATGTVTFSSGSTVLGTATIVNGVATLTTTALPVGTNAIIGTYSGNGNYTAATSSAGIVTVTPATSTLAAPSASPSSASYGSPVTLTQTVPPGATGTVTFMSGSTVLGTATIVNGVASLTTTSLPGGTNAVTGTYSGGGNFAPATSSPTTITIAPVTPVLGAPSASSTNAVAGTSITLSQTVPPGVTGTITFMSGSIVLGTGTIVNGVATLTTTAIPPGTNSVTAVYGGNGNYTASTSVATTITIAASATSVVLTATPLTVAAGAPVALTASISSNGTPIGSTTGGISVQFFDGTASLGTALLSPNGVATLTSTTLTVGSHAVTARFPGSGIYPAGSSNSVTVTIAQITATLPSPVASPTSGVYGTSITLTQIMPPGATGTVTFMTGNVVLGAATIVNGVATLTTSAIPAGTNAITAVYSGNATYAPTSSTSGTVTIQQATPAVPTLTASPTSTVFGAPVTLTATFPGSLSGSVGFFSGATSVGSALITNGAATLTTSTLPVGTDAVTATFTGNNNYASVSSPVVTVTITPPTYTIVANPPSLTIHAGQTGTTVLTFTPVGGYTGTFTITCAGLPANAACQFLQNGVSNPIVVMNGSNQPVQATLNLMTSVPSTTAAMVRPASPTPSGRPSGSSQIFAFTLPLGLIALAGSIRTRKRLGPFGSLLALTLATGAVLGGLAGCGGGGFGVTATPVGKSVVQVTATASAVSTPGSGNGGDSGAAPTPALSLSITIIQ